MVLVPWLNGVATTLRERIKPWALYTHCYGHALNLAVQEVVKKNLLLRDMVEEITKLMKKFPKREKQFLRR